MFFSGERRHLHQQKTGTTGTDSSGHLWILYRTVEGGTQEKGTGDPGTLVRAQVLSGLGFQGFLGSPRSPSPLIWCPERSEGPENPERSEGVFPRSVPNPI